MIPLEVKHILKKLRTQVPTIFPVRVRRRRDMDKTVLGCCNLITPESGSPYFSILVAHGLGPYLTRLVLIHEYAHAFAWTEAHPEVDDHGPEWGVAYARCYRAVYNLPMETA